MIDPLWPDSPVAVLADTVLRSASGVLYVGVPRWGSVDVVADLAACCPVRVLEVWEPETVGYVPPENVTVTVGDVRGFQQHVDGCDVLWWAQGPEHLERREARAVIVAALRWFRQIVVESPDGDYPQGAVDGNPYQRHLSTWYEHDFTALGLRAVAYESNLLAVGTRP